MLCQIACKLIPRLALDCIQLLISAAYLGDPTRTRDAMHQNDLGRPRVGDNSQKSKVLDLTVAEEASAGRL